MQKKTRYHVADSDAIQFPAILIAQESPLATTDVEGDFDEMSDSRWSDPGGVFIDQVVAVTCYKTPENSNQNHW